MGLKDNIVYNAAKHRMELKGLSLDELLLELNRPLSVILQITRNCHFNCEFCSEKDSIPNPSLDELDLYAKHLQDVPRIFLSGGEPLTREDFPSVVDIFKDGHILGLPTNAVASDKNLSVIKNNHISVNVGLDGPRNITSRVRGDYDFIMKGIRNFIKEDIPFSLTAVILRSTMDSVLYTCQMADTLGAKKMKFVLPIPKGNALNLNKNEYIESSEAEKLSERIRTAKEKFGWKTTYTFTIWNELTEGYSILVYPNGKTYAWPVFGEADKVQLLGDLHYDSIDDIWYRYPYKYNHVNKYLGSSVIVI